MMSCNKTPVKVCSPVSPCINTNPYFDRKSYNPDKQYFCKRWGHLVRNTCPDLCVAEPVDTMKDVKQMVISMNHFSPLNPDIGRSFRPPRCCLSTNIADTSTTMSYPRLPQPCRDIISTSTKTRPPSCPQKCPKYVPATCNDLPFRISVGWPKTEIQDKGPHFTKFRGLGALIHRAPTHDLRSIYRTHYEDFYTKKGLDVVYKYYRTPKSINNKRTEVYCRKEENKCISSCEPISVSAKLIRGPRNANNPTIQVCLPSDVSVPFIL